MKNFLYGLQKGTKILAAMLATVLCLSTPAMAQTYTGYNPVSGLNSTLGADVSIGPVPVITGCGTISSELGGPTAGKFLTTATTGCAVVITFPGAAPNGWYCWVADLTTVADTFTQASFTTTSCTFTSRTIAASDQLVYTAIGF